MADGDWSDYVASAGTDQAALTGAADVMGDATAAAEPALESIDTTALPEDAADDVSAAQYGVGEAASWDQWAKGDLADAASWQDQAAGDIRAAQEWADFGNMDAAQESLGAAASASDIAAETAGTAQSDLGIGAEYVDGAVSDMSSAADSIAYDPGSVDSGSAADA
jgi:hypothetical protein